MRNIFSRKKGAIALTTTTLFLAIMIVGGISLVSVGVNLSHSAKTYNDYSFAKYGTINCLEQSLFELTFDMDFTGVVSYAEGNLSCSANILNIASFPLYKQIDLSGNFIDSNYYESKTVDLSQNPIEIIE